MLISTECHFTGTINLSLVSLLLNALYKNNIIPTIVISNLYVLIFLYVRYKFLYLTYRRGIPINPIKCCGKKVRFTPKKIKL